MGGIVLVVAAAVVVAGAAWLLLAHTRLVRARNAVAGALAQIDVQLRRRHDLVPGLVEAARAHMAHERETLEAVIAARDHAEDVRGRSRSMTDRRSHQGEMAAVAGAEGALTRSLGELLLRVEAYPELRSSEVMMGLSEELISTENRVAYARQAYNDAVLAYNVMRAVVPANLVARSFGFDAAELWEARFAGVATTPGLTFEDR